MRLTKHEHACFVVTSGADSLVVDPGSYTLPLTELGGVVAIVITHEHADHWSSEQLDRIVDRNPEARIFGPAGVAAAASGYSVETVTDGDRLEVGSFSLAFYGAVHAVIHETIPVVDNVGVLINDLVYYAGDSFTVPPVEVNTLAVPIGAPWLKISEVMDYVNEIKPKRAFGTHEMVLSVIGKNLSHGRIENVTKLNGGEYFPLEPGESLDV
jgi:L-ascorbate metabolism protein UlaG (beta-lactamase superfamily)